MARLDRDGVEIHYEEHGDGPPSDRSHATRPMWDGQIAVLRNCYRVIAETHAVTAAEATTRAPAYSEATRPPYCVPAARSGR